MVIQDGLFGTGLRAHAYGARFRSCIDGIVHRSAEILILLLMSGSPELFTGCLKIKGHRPRHDAIPRFVRLLWSSTSRNGGAFATVLE
jgi:hypothetical protein